MSYRELFISNPLTFLGSELSYEEADYVVIGVPLDVTSTFRGGSRFAPTRLREASLNLETYSFRTALDVEDLKVADLGDLHTVADVRETLDRVSSVSREFLEASKLPVFLGGEHTLTLGVVEGIKKPVGVVSFDAHLDLRDEYSGLKTSHATFMRRISELIGAENIFEIGTRAVCREEIAFAKKEKINFVTSQEVIREGVMEISKRLQRFLAEHDNIYLSIDMDVLDPAFAPAVQNPEPEGLSYPQLIDLIEVLCKEKLIGFDLVEISPEYDNGATVIQGVKIIFETLAYIERSRTRNKHA